MNYNLELPKFLDVLYLPEHEKIPGYLSIECLFEEHPGWEIERGFTFQYLEGEVFFRVYPTLVQFPLGKASNLENAIEMTKQFLRKWVGHDIKDSQFRIETAEAIFQMEEEKRKREEVPFEERKRRIAEALEQYRKKPGKS